MKIIDIPTVTRDNPKGTTYSKDLFIYHGGWSDVDVSINYRLDALCVCIVERGTYATRLNSKEYIIKSGEVLVCHPNDFFNSLKFSDDFYATFIYANLDLLSCHISSLEIREALMKLKANPILHPEGDMATLLWSYIGILRLKERKTLDTAMSKPDQKIVILTATAMLVEIFAMIHSMPATSTPDNQSQPAILYQKFLNLLISLPVKPHDMDYYASELAVTPKYLSHVCKRESGKTANEWIREYVMHDAHRYLTSTDFSIKEIASRLGFSNFSFFCQSVKRFWGQTPLQLRNHH